MPEKETAVLIVDTNGEVEYANPRAEALFLPILPVGCRLPALFTRSGTTGGDVFNSVNRDSNPACARLTLSDGRLLDGILQSLSGGAFVLSLNEVTETIKQPDGIFFDDVTELPSRTFLFTHFAEQIEIARNAHQSLAVLCINIDRFKTVRNTLGHQIGDNLLRKIADRLRSVVSDKDLIACLGGDEFAIIQTGASQPDAGHALAARLVDLISRTYIMSGEVIHIGATIGIALFPDHGEETDVLFKNADLALSRAKAEGRGCYRFFELGTTDPLQGNRLLEIDLRKALPLQQLQLFYQPQISAATNAVVGFEALIRWHHPDRGLISPAEFIPLAEHIGLIIPIGEWVLRTACRDAAAWPFPISVAVNLSPAQFQGSKLAVVARTALKQSGLDPSRLELEVTENALLDDAGAVMDVFKDLQALGVRFSLDDFGTGYSSLNYLQKFPFSKIKIDRSFVQGIDGDQTRRAIFRAITDLASALKMTTTAEGVETPAELECVRAQGCTEIQGYLTGRPLSPEAAKEFITSLWPHPSSETDADTKQLFRLVYYSRNLVTENPDALKVAIASILAKSRVNNVKTGVTGALMFNAGGFGQVLEGSRAAVEALFERIQQDDRHTDISLLAFEPVKIRIFENWSMGFVGASTDDAATYGSIMRDGDYDLSRMTGDAMLETLHRLTLEEEHNT